MSNASTLTLREFETFREFFYRKTGIAFDHSKRCFVERRLTERMAVRRCADFRSYFSILRTDSTGKECQLLTLVLSRIFGAKKT